ncbi:MAG: hypothetical protein ACOCRO_07345 [Halanaerobiales bacterium]
MKIKDIALIGIMSATITAGKLALSFLPNVEVVTLLFILYTVSFGWKHALMAAIIFSTTEIFIYGFYTWLLGYFLIWPLLIFIVEISKRKIKTEYFYASIAGIFGLSFGFFFAIIESFFYGISYGFAYWIRGIPFDIVHGFSNFIIVLLLYKPLKKVLLRLNKNKYSH